MAHARQRWMRLALIPVWLLATMAPAAEGPPALNVYFGSFGAETLYSGEQGTPRDVYEHARAVDGMDFLAMTSRGPSSSLSEVAALVNATSAGRFVALSGRQYGPASGGQRVTVFELRESADSDAVPAERPDLFYRSWLPRQMDTTLSPPIVHLADPQGQDVDTGILNLGSSEAFRAAAAPYVRTLQIMSGRSNGPTPEHAPTTVRWRPYLNYLNAGFRLAPTADWEGSSRTRGPAPGQRTAVLARSLSKNDILDSVRQRRVYASEDRNLTIGFSINGHPMGSVVPMAEGTPLRIELTFADPDESGAYHIVSLRHDVPGGGLDAERQLSGTDFRGDGRVVFTQFKRGGTDEYFLANIVQEGADGTDSAWTAPIWLVSTEGR